MLRKFISLQLATAVFCAAALHAAETYASTSSSENGEEILVWQYHVVGTPAFDGAPKIGEPSFAAPAPLQVNFPNRALCKKGTAFGEFEAYITAEGIVEDVHSHHEPVTGNACQRKYVLPAIRAWRFSPATFEGKPTPVYMWIGVSPE
jgi:hypothetical protein